MFSGKLKNVRTSEDKIIDPLNVTVQRAVALKRGSYLSGTTSSFLEFSVLGQLAGAAYLS